jgi:hypothetical protein
LKTTDEELWKYKEKKSSPPNVCISGVVIVFIIPIWQGPMSSIIVFIDLEGLSGVWPVLGMPTTPNKNEKKEVENCTQYQRSNAFFGASAPLVTLTWPLLLQRIIAL